jgi:hypothetical protein
MKRMKMIFVPVLFLSMIFSCALPVSDSGQSAEENKNSENDSSRLVTVSEDFESASKISYTSGDVSFKSGIWTLNDGLVGSSSNDVKNGSKSIRIRNSGTAVMKFDKQNGAGTVSVKHAKYGTDSSSIWSLWYSTNGGTTWIQTGSAVTTSSTSLETATFNVNVNGIIRFEIRKTDGSSNRINFDDFTINSFSDSNSSGSSSSISSNISSGGSSSNTKKWTVMVYMAADNNLSSYSKLDIDEMKNVGSSSDVNIVTLWDDQDGHHGYYNIEKDKAVQVKETSELDTGSVKTVKDFIDFTTLNYPSENYMFIYWNHGGAVDRTELTKGVAWDDTHGSHLSEVNQKEVAVYFTKKIGKKIDIIGFDACLMATAELAYQYKDTASLLIASEQTIAGEGWDYNFLTDLKNNPSITKENLAKSALSYYKNYYSQETDVTLSITDLSYADNLGIALDDFSNNAINSQIGGSTFESLSQSDDFSGYTKDLYVYMKKIYSSSVMTDEVKTSAYNVMNMISKNLVISKWNGSDWKSKAYGLSITLKSDTTVYSWLDICKDTKWDEFLTFAGF